VSRTPATRSHVAVVGEDVKRYKPRRRGVAHFFFAVRQPEHLSRGVPVSGCGREMNWLRYGSPEELAPGDSTSFPSGNCIISVLTSRWWFSLYQCSVRSTREAACSQ
jgi:hypothetical protein